MKCLVPKQFRHLAPIILSKEQIQLLDYLCVLFVYKTREHS
jgi:hypothetical protein